MRGLPDVPLSDLPLLNVSVIPALGTATVFTACVLAPHWPMAGLMAAYQFAVWWTIAGQMRRTGLLREGGNPGGGN